MSDVKTKVNIKLIIQILITIILMIILNILKNENFGSNWVIIVAHIALITLTYQIIFIVKSKRGFLCFEFWFIIFSYLFMFGQIFLVGLFGIEKIEALGYVRNVIDERYDDITMYKASLFIIACIQVMFLFLIIRDKPKSEITYSFDKKIYNISKILLLIGIPCHLIYSIRMVLLSQSVGSYDAITDMVGLIDDFANFMIYGIICLFFSHKFNKKQCRYVLIAIILYMIIIMILTGDRRYQIVSIIVLILSYMKSYNQKLTLKHLRISICWIFDFRIILCFKRNKIFRIVKYRRFSCKIHRYNF